MPRDLRPRPLAHAIVELIIRMASRRKWVWSTVASAFAACASALASLPVYTTETRSVLIRDDPYFSQAAKRAQQNARTTTGVESLTAALTHDEYLRLISSAGIKNNRVRMLLQLMWHFAARPKEMREARPYDIVFGDQLADRASHVSVTFVTGKVVPVCGPYTIHVVLPKEVVCELRGFVNGKPALVALFTENDQAALSKAIASLRAPDQQRLGLRSVRRGALLHLAGKGVGDVELVQLSGHKRMDTLHRYLGWGRSSATMRLAASARHRAQITGGAEHGEPARQDLSPAQQPPKMGPNSGFKGRAGKRVPKPPSFFPRKAPSREDLGVAPRAEDSAAYPLHIKHTSRVNFAQVADMAAGTPLAEATELARRWCVSDELYGPTIRVDERKLPYAAFTADHIQQLLDADKIRPYTGDVRGFVKAFVLPNHQKKRLRVIAEPVINSTCAADFIPDLAYPSRLERRANARGALFDAELDFSAYFDQFDLGPDTARWMVFRAREEVAGHRLFALTRLPMGAKFAPSVAQTVTSVLVFPLLQLPDVRVDTCIDNIRVVATSAEAFVRALTILLERIRRASITLNDAHLWEQSPDEWLQRCAVTDAPRIFLGERYVRDTISNSDNCVTKLADAWARFKEGHQPSTYSLRNFASLVGLMLFMAHTINVDLSNYHTLLRAYGSIIADATGWDAPLTVTSDEVHDQLQGLVDILLENAPVALPVLAPPSRALEDYDAAIEVDASGSAWAAIVRLRDGRTFTLQQRWAYSVGHSAHAEPSAATRAVQWVRRFLGRGACVALVTDHRALATAQRRWNSNFGGFSSSGYHLNEFYRELYRSGGGQVFYVEGVSNQADALSRSPDAPLTLKVDEADLTFRDLRLTEHPYETIPRKPYQV
jgi:integrase